MSTIQKGKTVADLEAEEQKRRSESQKRIHDAKVKETKQALRDALDKNDDIALARACSSFFGLAQKPPRRSNAESPKPITA